MKNTTLTKKIFYRVAPTILVTIVIIGGLAFYTTRREINKVYDAQLMNNASVLWTLVEQEISSASNVPRQVEDIDLPRKDPHYDEEADEYADARMFRVWVNDRTMMFSSNAFPETIKPQRSGFSLMQYDWEEWRVYSFPIPGKPIIIEIGEKLSLRNTLVSNILFDLFWPLLILMPIVVALLWLIISNGLRTIRFLSRQIRSRSPDDLAPLALESLPLDLVPLGRSINQLLEKLQHSLNSERRFSDLAAHQLRTPLAALKLQIQLLMQLEKEEERQSIIAELPSSVERAASLVNKLLTLSRISHQPIQFQSLPLYNVTASIIANMGALIAQKNLNVILQGDNHIKVRADETLLQLLIGNLMENAVKFTPPQGSITIEIEDKAGECRLLIADSGPGIAAAQRELVFQRFYRTDDATEDGSGLGLAIVSDVLERLNGRIELHTSASGMGLGAEIFLPKA